MGDGMMRSAAEIMRRCVTIAVFLGWAASAIGGDSRADALEKARRKVAGAPKGGNVQRSSVRFPPQESLGSASTAEGALALWGQFSPVLRDRMLRANRNAALNVIGVLQGADTMAANAGNGGQRNAALAQIQATCATFLTSPGIQMTTQERDLLAAYAAKVGEARQRRDGK